MELDMMRMSIFLSKGAVVGDRDARKRETNFTSLDFSLFFVFLVFWRTGALQEFSYTLMNIAIMRSGILRIFIVLESWNLSNVNL